MGGSPMPNLIFTLQTVCRSIFQKWKPSRTIDLLNILQRFPTMLLLDLNPNSLGPYTIWPLPTLPPHLSPHSLTTLHTPRTISFSLANMPSSLHKVIFFTFSQRDFPSELPVFSFIAKMGHVHCISV